MAACEPIRGTWTPWPLASAASRQSPWFQYPRPEAELVLEELRTLQLQVNSLAVTSGQPSGFSRAPETLQPRALGDRLQDAGEMRSPSSSKRSPISKATARVEAFQRLEALSAGAQNSSAAFGQPFGCFPTASTAFSGGDEAMAALRASIPEQDSDSEEDDFLPLQVPMNTCATKLSGIGPQPEEQYGPPTRSWDVTPLDQDVKAALVELGQGQSNPEEFYPDVCPVATAGEERDHFDDEVPTRSWGMRPCDGEIRDALRQIRGGLQRKDGPSKSITLGHQQAEEPATKCLTAGGLLSFPTTVFESLRHKLRSTEHALGFLLRLLPDITRGLSSRFAPSCNAPRFGAQCPAGLETRVSKLEKEVLASPTEEGQGETSHLQDRLRHLESEVEGGLQPLRRHQVSLRALEETSMKVEQLQQTLQQLPLDVAVQRSADAITALEEEGRLRAGPLSLLDAHKVQTSLDQVMTAMEALVRQRNADVQLVNGYLGEVYRRIERDLPSDKGQRKALAQRITAYALTKGIFQKLERIQAQTSAVRAECHSIADVRIKELEERLLHEAATTAELAESTLSWLYVNFSSMGRAFLEAQCQGNRRQVTRLELALQDALDQLRAAEARLPALQDLTERRAASETAREAAMSELRKDLLRLRQDVSQLTTEGGFAASERQHASFSALSATLMARVDKEAKETSRVFAGLEDQLKSLHERVRAAEIAGSSASTLETCNFSPRTLPRPYFRGV
eukprot:s708_g2.t1